MRFFYWDNQHTILLLLPNLPIFVTKLTIPTSSFFFLAFLPSTSVFSQSLRVFFFAVAKKFWFGCCTYAAAVATFAGAVRKVSSCLKIMADCDFVCDCVCMSLRWMDLSCSLTRMTEILRFILLPVCRLLVLPSC